MSLEEKTFKFEAYVYCTTRRVEGPDGQIYIESMSQAFSEHHEHRLNFSSTASDELTPTSPSRPYVAKRPLWRPEFLQTLDAHSYCNFRREEGSVSSDALNKMRMRWGVGPRFCPTVKFSTRRGHECIPGKQPGQRMQSIASGCGGPLFRLLSKGPFWSSDALNKKRMRSGRGFIPGSIYNIS